jgi:hypothetical protein
MTQADAYCLYCERDSNQVPLVPLIFQGQELWICPQHLPILIHSPAKLVVDLPPTFTDLDPLSGKAGR